MFLKLLHIVYIFSILKLFYAYQFQVSLEDNYDYKILKNYMKNNNNTYFYGNDGKYK